ncbi:MAG: hypothetical protein QXT74_05430 [Candidatus Nezhaarchaeales archaeon]
MTSLARLRRGVSEIVSSLALSLIVLTFMSIVAAAFTQSSKGELESYITMIRRDRARLLEHITLISVDVKDEATVWLFNTGRCSVEIRGVYVNGTRVPLNSTIIIPPGQALPLRLNTPLDLGRRQELVIYTSNGGVFRFEVETPALEQPRS